MMQHITNNSGPDVSYTCFGSKNHPFLAILPFIGVQSLNSGLEGNPAKPLLNKNGLEGFSEKLCTSIKREIEVEGKRI